MATKEKIESQFLNRPIAGSSLTSSPDQPAPWETPPKYTDPAETLGSLSKVLLEPKNMSRYMKLIRDDVPITQVAKTILFTGFASGKITPDMALILLKPITTLLLMLSEKMGIDPVLYPGENTKMSLQDEIKFIQEMSEKDVADIIQKDESVSEDVEPEVGSLLGGGMQ